MVKLSDKEYKEFIRWANKKVAQLGLKNWKVYYDRLPMPNDYACTTTDPKGMVATIAIADEMNEINYDSLEIRETAYHEVYHLLLAKLVHLARSRYCTEEEIERAEEEIVVALCNMDKRKEKKIT